MRAIMILSIVVLGFLARGEPTNSSPASVAPPAPPQPAPSTPPATPSLAELKPNEIVVGKRTYSGIAIEAARSRNPLQLINPFAPAEYGRAEDNLLRDPITGRPAGLKVFGFQF